MSGTDKVIAQLNFGEDGVYIVQGGKIVERIRAMENGQTTIFYRHGEVLDVEETGRRRVKKG